MTSQHWAQQHERGSKFFLNLTRLIVQYCPLWVIRIVTFVVVSYFFLTSAKARRHIRRYHQRLQRTFLQLTLPRYALFRHFLAFGEAIADRFAVWQKKIRYPDLILDDSDNVYRDIRSEGRGQILICSHFANIEICRALVDSRHHGNFRLNILVHNRHAQAFNKALEKAGATSLPLIQVEDLDTQKMLELNERIERGEWISIAADRIPVRGNKTEQVDFLGSPATFPQGPWLLASLLKTPINTVFCVKKRGEYHLKLRHFSPPIEGRGKQRNENIKRAMQQYADILAKECEENPLYWFNFYDFWDDYSK
ncbi:LpxL/LpxP family acyltransferase [Aggregatibacter actinomycetemcomitans]|uniref:LpxL/LpxP family acyltransferase n=1 Tax=Aggregatibacter actinomycetemcomitans TaxID=714 RepID=UPI0021C74454|nr:glycosyl transferase family 2 [Aggregatibacter actinomycetemcomitans]UXM97986.1 glycosyl transferase family 2 [Aggregatibacter actinomycetemcomitans]